MKDLTAVTWLGTKRRWNASELVWSIQVQYIESIFPPSTLRPGECDILLAVHGHIHPSVRGPLVPNWCVTNGGPFSAQSADLRSVWGAKQRTDLLRRLGQLSFLPRGHPLWSTLGGNTVSLAQFRDNILVGVRGTTAVTEMQCVCNIPLETWRLPVLCDCMMETLRVCQGTCMTRSLAAMGFTVHLHGSGPPLVYAQPSGLTSTYHLKYSVTLQSPRNAHTHISAIIVSAVLNVQPFLHTWLSCLLSITAWAQIACLSSYPRSTVLRALHSAVLRIVSRTVWDVDSTLRWCQHAVYCLPSTRDAIFFKLHRWVQTQACCPLALMPATTPRSRQRRQVPHHDVLQWNDKGNDKDVRVIPSENIMVWHLSPLPTPRGCSPPIDLCLSQVCLKA